MKHLLVVTALFCVFNLSGCAKLSGNGKVVIGLSIPDLKQERWQRDRQIFVNEANRMGAEVFVLDALGDPKVQIQQCEDMIERGVKVLVVVPQNADAAAPIVEKAHEKGIKVICYDRLIANSNPDLYISFDNEQVGEIQANELMRIVPEGNYLELLGDPGDKNAEMVHDGHINVLKGAIDKGKIKIVLSKPCDKWLRSEAKRITQDALTRFKIDAILASNDGTAAGAIAALGEMGIAGRIPVSGQDADLINCQYITKGIQTVTVYKPIKKLATFSAWAAFALARGLPVEGTHSKVNNGSFEVSTVYLDPIPVTKDNMEETVISDGFHKKEAIYGK